MNQTDDKHGALIELAATWCEAQGRAKLDPMAPIWERRAKMLREGYKPQLVSAPSATAATSEPMGNEPLPPDAEMAVRELAEVDRALKSLLGEWPVYLTHTEQDGSPAKDTLTRAGAMLLCLQKAQPTETVARKESIPEAWKINPIGYAVRMKNGPFVGIWQDRATADMVRDKQPASHGDEVIPVWSSPRAEADADQAKDAARWRWLVSRINYRNVERNMHNVRYVCREWVHETLNMTSDSITVAVDAAMRETDGPHGGGKDG